MPGSGGVVTRLLSEFREGNQEAANQLVPLVYGELRRMAGAYLQRERPGHTLQATALVNEAYIRLVGGEPAQWQNRAHFFAIAAYTMRQVLVEYARRRHVGKRGGVDARKVDIDAELFIAECKLEDVIVIDEVLARLALIDPQQSRLGKAPTSGRPANVPGPRRSDGDDRAQVALPRSRAEERPDSHTARQPEGRRFESVGEVRKCRPPAD